MTSLLDGADRRREIVVEDVVEAIRGRRASNELSAQAQLDLYAEESRP